MFCERCGNQLTDIQRFCPSCGKPIGMSVVPIDRQGKVERNLQLLGILWLVAGALELIGCFVLLILGNVVFRISAEFNPAHVFPGFLRGLFTMIGIFVGIISFMSIASGWGLLQRETWARPLAIVAAFLALLNMPLGTALGVYTLWVLMPYDSGQEYDRISKAA